MNRSSAYDISKLLRPSSIAIVGATPRSDASGHVVLKNLLVSGYEGPIYPVNPRYDEVLGQRCYPSLDNLPEKVDAAFLAVPAASGPDLVEQAATCGIGAVYINANGYADSGPEGEVLQRRLTNIANKYGIAVCGPNNMGLVNLWQKAVLWMSDFPQTKPGPVAIISQSGSVAIALSQDPRGLGLGYIVTAGNEAVCNIADYLAFIASDEHIQTIMLFIESLRQPEATAEAAQLALTNDKRVLALKVGRSEVGQAAVANHSGALAGEDAVVRAFFKHHGIIQLNDLDEMLEAGVLLSACPDPPNAKGLTAVTLSGGEAAMIADLAESIGLALPQFGEKTETNLRKILPPVSVISNPLDVWGTGWNPDIVSKVLAILNDDNSIGPIVCFGDPPLSGGNDAEYIREMAEAMVEQSAHHRIRMILVNNLATVETHPGVAKLLRSSGIPYLRGTRAALAAIIGWLDFAPKVQEHVTAPYPSALSLRERDKIGPLKDHEVFALLNDAGIPVSSWETTNCSEVLVAAARRFGYPVALKASVPGFAHKTEHDLVRLSLQDDDALVEAAEQLWAKLKLLSASQDAAELMIQPMTESGVELFIAARNVPGFGSVVMVGPGGLFVETLRDVSFRIGPVGAGEVRDMLHETHAATFLSGLRGKAASDVGAAINAVVALSSFAAATADRVASVEINPLIVLPEGRGAVAVDAVLELRGPPHE